MTIEELTTEVEVLKAEKAILEESNLDLEAANEGLTKEVEGLKAEISDLKKGDKNKLKAEIEELKAQLAVNSSSNLLLNTGGSITYKDSRGKVVIIERGQFVEYSEELAKSWPQLRKSGLAG